MEPAQAIAELLTAAGRADPYPLYRELRQAGPILPVSDSYVVALGYAACDAILRDPGLLVEDAAYLDRWGSVWRSHRSLSTIVGSMLSANSPEHERVRRLVSGAFTARRVAGLRETVANLAAGYADWLAGSGGEPVDFIGEFAYPLPINVICALLGIPEPDRGWFRPRAAELTVALDMRAEVDLTAADRATIELQEYFTDLIAYRRASPGEDLTSALVAAHDADPGTLDGPTLLANLTLLLVAGFETTTNLLGNGLAALMASPDHAQALRADPGLAPGYVAEMLRWDSPVQLTSRWTSRPVRLAGTDLPAGASVLVLLGAANRDPARFSDPDRFDPGRTGVVPLSFGAGAHFCLGQALARLEAEVAFPLLVKRFEQINPAGPAVRMDRLTLRGWARLPVSLA